MEMIYRSLGNTGENVSAIGIGGWRIGMNGRENEIAAKVRCQAATI